MCDNDLVDGSDAEFVATGYERKITALHDLKQSLLHQAYSGEL